MENYTSLEDIQAKCKETRLIANRKKTVCKMLWAQLTTKEEESFQTPTQRLLSNANKAVMIIDGVMFGAKMYRLFRGHKGEKKKSVTNRLFNIFS